MKTKTIEQFNKLITEFCQSNIILTSSPISNILKFIVGKNDYLKLVEESAKLTNYSTEFKRATSSGTNEYAFSLPESDFRIISLVTGLLLEFDNGKISIIDFISTYFPSQNLQDSFSMFCESVIKPYEKSFLRVYNNASTNDLAELEAPKAKNYLFDKAKDECHEILNFILNKLSNDTYTKENLRNDATKMAKGMLYAFELNNPLLLDYMFTGLSSLLINSGEYNKELLTLKTILKEFGVIS